MFGMCGFITLKNALSKLHEQNFYEFYGLDVIWYEFYGLDVIWNDPRIALTRDKYYLELLIGSGKPFFGRNFDTKKFEQISYRLINNNHLLINDNVHALFSAEGQIYYSYIMLKTRDIKDLINHLNNPS